jgi:hypothetical protein
MKHVRKSHVKDQGKMPLDETKRWKYVGSETTCETDDKTKDETIVKRWMKLVISEMKKTTLDLLYPWKTMDCNTTYIHPTVSSNNILLVFTMLFT